MSLHNTLIMLLVSLQQKLPTKPRHLKAKKIGLGCLCVVYQFDIPLFYCFLLVDTPPPPYHATEATGTQNGRPVDATADSHLVLSMPNGGNFADEQLNVAIFQEYFPRVLPSNKKNQKPNQTKTKCAGLLIHKCFKGQRALLCILTLAFLSSIE